MITEYMAVSRQVPSASGCSRRTMPSNVAPSFSIAARERTFVEPVWILTRP
jgi:hypothetical protein